MSGETTPTSLWETFDFYNTDNYSCNNKIIDTEILTKVLGFFHNKKQSVTKSSLKDIKELFFSGNNNKGASFHINNLSVGIALCVLLEDELLLGKSVEKRIIGIYLLYMLYPSLDNIKLHPFLYLFVQIAESSQSNDSEKSFLQFIFNRSTSQVEYLSSHQLCTSTEWIKKKENRQLILEYTRFLDKKMINNNNSSRDTSFSRLIYDPDCVLGEEEESNNNSKPNFSTTDLAANGIDTVDNILCSSKFVIANGDVSLDQLRGNKENHHSRGMEIVDLKSASESFEASFVRPAPPVLAIGEDELVWMNPIIGDNKLEWEKLLLDENKKLYRRLRYLSFEACQKTLSLLEQKEIQEILDYNSNFALQSGITPEKLPLLVENNHLVALEFLLKLINHQPQFSEYLDVLVHMEMSLPSMVVVNRLTSVVDLPITFTHMYITNCMSTCETMQDRFMQNRLVRLVCVFLQSLIRNKIINVNDLYIEVQAFCIEFSRIREAAGLFRLLRDQHEHGNNVESKLENSEF